MTRRTPLVGQLLLVFMVEKKGGKGKRVKAKREDSPAEAGDKQKTRMRKTG